MHDIFNGHINKPVSTLAEEISLYNTDIKNIKGYFFATEYHPLLENFNVLKLLNDNSFGIEFEKYKYVFNSENNLLISIE